MNDSFVFLIHYRYEEKFQYLKRYQATPEVELLKQRLENLEQVQHEKEQEPVRIIKALEAQHIQATDQLEHMYETQLLVENEKYSKLLSKMDKQKYDYERQLAKQKEEFRLDKTIMEEESAPNTY